MKRPTLIPQSCGGCKFYRKPPPTPPSSGIVRFGTCLRFPRNEEKTPADYCGEFKES